MAPPMGATLSPAGRDVMRSMTERGRELSPPTAVTAGAAAENALVFSPLRPCGAPPPKARLSPAGRDVAVGDREGGGWRQERSGARGAASDAAGCGHPALRIFKRLTVEQ